MVFRQQAVHDSISLQKGRKPTKPTNQPNVSPLTTLTYCLENFQTRMVDRKPNKCPVILLSWRNKVRILRRWEFVGENAEQIGDTHRESSSDLLCPLSLRPRTFLHMHGCVWRNYLRKEAWGRKKEKIKRVVKTVLRGRSSLCYHQTVGKPHNTLGSGRILRRALP